MTNSSSTVAGKATKSRSLINALLVVAASGCILLVLWMLVASQSDPYIKATLNLKGSKENGERLFRMNCAGCHGLNGQGLVGPSLHAVSTRLNDSKLIKQIVNGDTPPMPSFQIEPQAMADLITHMHSID